MAEVLRLLGARHAIVAHGQDGLDELTLDGETQGWEVVDGQVRPWTTSPEGAGLPSASLDQIQGGSKEENAATMRRIFQGSSGPFRDVVLLNSAAVLLVGGEVEDIAQGVERAARVIDDGAALDKLESLVELSQRLGQELA